MVEKDTALYFFLFLGVFVILGILAPSSFLSSFNLSSMAFQIPEFGILALGMMIAIITGGIDLSMIATANLSAIFASLAMYAYLGTGESPFMVMLVITLVCIVSGMLLGLFNGILISYLRIPAMLTTLGTMKLYDGISTVITGGQPLRNYPPIVAQLANDAIGGIPYSFLIFIVIVFIMSTFMGKTKLGFQMYMFGENQTAANFTGIKRTKILVATYMIAGMLAGLSGLIMMSRFNSIKIGYGNSYQLLTLLVAILGGVSPAGGKGKVLNVVFSILALQCIASGFNILGFTNYMRNVIYGTVLVLVMILNVVYPLIVQKRALKNRDAVLAS